MTAIQWTDATWNPVTGCTPITTGCKYCYAKEMHRRLAAMGQAKYQEPFETILCHTSEMGKPVKWRKPRMVFVNSMSDLFHKDVPFDFILDVFQVMQRTPRHTYQVLTKRPHRMLEFCGRYGIGYGNEWPANVWMGCSASTQGDLEIVVPELMESPAKIRFLSLEPLLGPMQFRSLALKADWVIAGCESGPHRRECDSQWLAGIVRQCIDADIPVFVKQAQAGRQVEKMPTILGRVWDQMPRNACKTRGE